LLNSGSQHDENHARQKGKKMAKEMSRAVYRAEQTPDKVTVYATGVHHEVGHKVSFERVGVTIFPPQFSFMHEAPAQPAAKAKSPFTHTVSFETDRKVESIVIYDADGRHCIPVSQMVETDLACSPASV